VPDKHVAHQGAAHVGALGPQAAVAAAALMDDSGIGSNLAFDIAKNVDLPAIAYFALDDRVFPDDQQATGIGQRLPHRFAGRLPAALIGVAACGPGPVWAYSCLVHSIPVVQAFDYVDFVPRLVSQVLAWFKTGHRTLIGHAGTASWLAKKSVSRTGSRPQSSAASPSQAPRLHDASIAAPVASGWCACRVGFAPLASAAFARRTP